MSINNVHELLDIVDITQEHLKSSSFPEPSLLSSLRQSNKSNVESIVCRNFGNNEYNRGDDIHQALEWYTKSVAWATEGSRELALAYGNRSAVLFRLRLFEASLLDVNRALKCDCPNESKIKLLSRKADCFAALGSRQSLFNDDLTDPVKSTTNELPKLNQNPLLPNTSSKIKLMYNKKWGRHLVAAKDIEPGEILSIEEFIGASLNSRQYYTHCSHCFVKCEALIGCINCSKVMYCSSQCRTRAHNTYHRVECNMWPFYEDERLSSFDIAAVRTFLAGTEQGAKLSDLTNAIGSLCNNNKFDFVNRRFKKDYLSVLKLQWTFGKPPKTYVLLAVKVIIVLQHLSFFKDSINNNCESTNKLQQFATLAMIVHLTSINYFSFPMWDITPQKEESSDNEYPIGLGACALHSLVNHSCDPNVADVMGKRIHTYFSVRPISKGQQIFFAYGLSFAKSPLKERLENLKSFGFKCHCRACTEKWPSYSLLKRQAPEFISKNRKTVDSLLAIEKLLNKTADRHHKCTNESFEHAVRYSKTIRQIISSPSALIVRCEDLVTRYIRETHGNFYHKYQVAGESDADHSAKGCSCSDCSLYRDKRTFA